MSRTLLARFKRGAGAVLWRAAPALPAVVGVAVLAAYAGQLGLGRWQSDEFTLLINQRDWGRRILPPRLAYAPRPFSEGVLFLYGEAVLALGRPLVVPFLGALWAGVFGAAVLAARSALPPSRLRWATALGLVAALFAFVLATNRVTELFYWPVAAAAYLPVAGAGVVLLFLLSGRPDGWRRLGCGLALLVAAASSEMGAALALGFAAAAAVEAATRPGVPFRLAAVRDGAWWAVPGLAGLAVMGMLLVERVGLVELGSDTQPYTGDAAGSVGMAVRQLAIDLVGGDGAGGDPWAMLGALGTKLLFALGFALVLRRADPCGTAPGRMHAVLAAAFGTAAFFSAAAAYYHYGTLCCERQAVTRHWLADLLAIMAMGWVLARVEGVQAGGVWAAGARHAWVRGAWPPALLALSLFPVLFRIDGLRQGYDSQRLAIDARARTWRSGQQAGTNGMEFYLPPDMDSMLVRGTSLPIRSFHVGPGTPALVSETGRFFGKAIVTVCQPWQNERSWLIHGQFIPACPPRDGPPDVVIPPSPTASPGSNAAGASTAAGGVAPGAP